LAQKQRQLERRQDVQNLHQLFEQFQVHQDQFHQLQSHLKLSEHNRQRPERPQDDRILQQFHLQLQLPAFLLNLCHQLKLSGQWFLKPNDLCQLSSLHHRQHNRLFLFSDQIHHRLNLCLSSDLTVLQPNDQLHQSPSGNRRHNRQ
jgi:hypothetical protein